MTKFVSLRIKKLKQADLSLAKNHNQRLEQNDKLIYDPSKTHNNICLKGDADLNVLVNERLNDLNVKTVKSGKNESVVAIEMVISASPEYFRNDPNAYGTYDQDKTDAWCKKNIDFLQQKYGDNFVRADLHLDEATPHLHAIITPIEQKEVSRRRTKEQIKNNEKASTYTANILNAKNMFNRDALIGLQTDAAVAVKDLGIKRGVHGSRAKHTKVAQMMQRMHEVLTIKPKVSKPNLKKLKVQEPKGLFPNHKKHREAESKRITEYVKDNFTKVYKACVQYKRQAELYKHKYEQEKERTDILVRTQQGNMNITDLLEQNINHAREMELELEQLAVDNVDLRQQLDVSKQQTAELGDAAVTLSKQYQELQQEHKETSRKLMFASRRLDQVEPELAAKSERLEKFEKIRERGNNQYSREIDGPTLSR